MRTKAQIDSSKIKPGQSTTASYKLIAGGKEFFNDLKDQIDKARVSVWLQFYTFEADDAGLPIAQALMNAATRGVDVYLMVDSSIHLQHNDYFLHVPRLNRRLQNSIVREWRATKRLLKTMKAAGVNVKMLSPIGLFRQKAFYRDHKKLVVIDAEAKSKAICYVGGINPSDHNESWNDFMVKMHGNVSQLVHKDLACTWQGKNSSGVQKYGDGLFITDARNDAHIIPYATKLIANAKKRVVVESAYLWGKDIMAALITAAKNGVHVEVIVPFKNNRRVFVLNGKHLKVLSQAGANVYRYQGHGGMTHTKALLADSTALFGSNNFSEFLSGKITEANIATKNAQLVSQLERFLKSDIRKSTKLS
jgi:cardiolipin synthase